MVAAYDEIERNFVAGKWKPSELDAGHFVEAVRRALDLELTGKYQGFDKQLPRFNDGEMRRYESLGGDESYRLLIPRALRVVYGIRSKRGAAHLSSVSPNQMDATIILYTSKWVLAELVRLKSGLPPDDTQRMVDTVIERQWPLVWKHGGITVVLDHTMKARDQVLLLLYDKSPRTTDELLAITEYSNRSGFREILRRLHKSRLIHVQPDGACQLLPPGLREAEAVLGRTG